MWCLYSPIKASVLGKKTHILVFPKWFCSSWNDFVLAPSSCLDISLQLSLRLNFVSRKCDYLDISRRLILDCRCIYFAQLKTSYPQQEHVCGSPKSWIYSPTAVIANTFIFITRQQVVVSLCPRTSSWVKMVVSME